MKKLITIIILNTRQGLTGGTANGYVVVPCGHPLHGVSGPELDESVEVYGGWTFGDTVGAVKSFKGDKEVAQQWADALAKYPGLNPDDMIYGFDTYHWGDTVDAWPVSRVQSEIDKAAELISAYKPKPADPIDVGNIGNYYGGLRIKKDLDGSTHWSIENWDGEHWDEIPNSLYNELAKYQAELDNPHGGGES